MNDPAASTGLGLRALLLAARALPLIAPRLLRKRMARGKEDPARWREKLGEPGLPRPEGRLIWLNAVGLGEVLALRGLIAAMAELDPDAQFLVTSSARSSAHVMGTNLPPRTRHQYLPIDAPQYVARFLDHWRPDLSVWAEQDLWPVAVTLAHRRGIPLAMVNARMTAASHAKRAKARGIYADALSRFALITAQEDDTAARLTDLGARAVAVTGSLKSAAPPLAVDHDELARLADACTGRAIWLAASTHPGDEEQAIAAAVALPDRLLILAPRDITRLPAIRAALDTAGLPHVLRSTGALPDASTRVWLADSYGEMGLWYSLAQAALVGGGFDRIGGHNPWEAVNLGCPVLHGPDTANFGPDYAQLHSARAALQVRPGDLALALTDPGLTAMPERAARLTAHARQAIVPLARDLLNLTKATRA